MTMRSCTGIALGFQPSAVSLQLSAFSFQPSAFRQTNIVVILSGLQAAKDLCIFLLKQSQVHRSFAALRMTSRPTVLLSPGHTLPGCQHRAKEAENRPESGP